LNREAQSRPAQDKQTINSAAFIATRIVGRSHSLPKVAEVANVTQSGLGVFTDRPETLNSAISHTTNSEEMMSEPRKHKREGIPGDAAMLFQPPFVERMSCVPFVIPFGCAVTSWT
jgi:hypothetical protein